MTSSSRHCREVEGILDRIRTLTRTIEAGDEVDGRGVEALLEAIREVDVSALGEEADALGEALVALHRATVRQQQVSSRWTSLYPA